MKKAVLLLSMLGVVLMGNQALTDEPSSTIPKEQKKEIVRQEWEKVIGAIKREEALEGKKPAKKESEIPKKFKKPISLCATQVPLQGVLSEIVRMARVSLTIQEEVNTTQPVSVEVADTPVAAVLETILSPLGYSCKMAEDSLYVYQVDTRIFRVALPPITQSYSSNLTNEPLSTAEKGGRSGAKITVSSVIDKASFWDDLKKDLPTLLSGKGKYTLNPGAGLITVTDSVPALERVENYITQINEEISRQLFIRVKVVEVTLSKDRALGIDWDAVTKHITLNTNLVPTEVSSAAAILSYQNVGGQDVWGVVLNALEEEGEIRIISQPQLLVLNNQPAMIQVGDVTTYVSRVETNVTEIETTHSVETSDIQEGVSLALCGRAMDDEYVYLTLTPVVGKVKEIRRLDFGDILIEAPKITSRALSTNVKVHSGDSIILGGLILEEKEEGRKRIPGLGRIPVLKYLFSYEKKGRKKTELVFLVTPEIVK